MFLVVGHIVPVTFNLCILRCIHYLLSFKCPVLFGYLEFCDAFLFEQFGILHKVKYIYLNLTGVLLETNYMLLSFTKKKKKLNNSTNFGHKWLSLLTGLQNHLTRRMDSKAHK